MMTLRIHTQRMIAVLLVALLLSPSLNYAAEDPCKGDQSSGSQTAHYCAAAKSADTAGKSQKMVGMIQAGVAAVCTTACVMAAMGNPIPEGYCSYTAIGGAVAGLLIAKKTSDKMMSLASAAGPLVSGLFVSDFSQTFALSKPDAAAAATTTPPAAGAETAANGATPPASGGGEFSMSCVSAGISALTAFMSFSGASKSSQTARENRTLASQMAQKGARASIEGRPAGLIALDAQNSSAPFGGGAIGKSQDGRTKTNPALAGVNSGESPCGGTGFSGALSCALASPDNNLPAFVSSPDFRAALEKTSGMSADSLFSIEDPQQMIQAGLGKVFNEDGQKALSQILGEARSGLEAEIGRGAYPQLASKPQSGSGFSFATDATFGEQTLSGTQEMNFEPSAHRNLASELGAENNPLISIFTRVSTRYQLTQDRVSALKYQGTENRMLGGAR